MTENAGRRVVVLGGAGRTGRLLVAEALREGRHVTALVRSPASSGLPVREGLDVVAGDARRSDDIARALEPGDAVVCAVGPSGRDSHGLYGDTARAMVAAAETVGVRRLVAITSSGVRADDPHHPWWYRAFLVPLMRATYRDMADLEAVVAASDLDWTVVRPGRLTDAPATGDYRVGDGENPRAGTAIPRQDLARFVVATLDDPRWRHHHPTLTR